MSTEPLPPDRPLLAALVRALPPDLLLVALTQQLPQRIWFGARQMHQRVTFARALQIGC